MSNELKHASVGTELTQAEFESAGLHILDGQAAGDMILASSASQLRRHPYAGRNAIINGCGMISQRVADFTLVKDTYGISADRFYGMAAGTAVSAGVFTKTAAANCGITGHAFKFAGVTITGTGIIYFRYRMEAKDALRFKNQTASFSCKAYHDAGSAINYTIYIRKANAADNFSAVTDISNSGAISVASSAETILPYLAVNMGDCSNGIELEIKAECGAVTSKNFEFTECQFEPGSLRTNFDFRPFQQELALCTRYYERIQGVTGLQLAQGLADNTGGGFFALNYAPKCMAPAFGYGTAYSDWSIRYKGSGVSEVTAFSTIMGIDRATLIAIATGTPLTPGEAVALRAVNGNAYLELIAEL